VSYVPSAQVFTPPGLTITPPLNSASPTSGSSTVSDPNTNLMTGNYSSSSTSFIDTLGSAQAPTLTVTGSPTSGSVTYTYTGPSGSGAAVKVNYTNYTIQTNFGCPEIMKTTSQMFRSLLKSPCQTGAIINSRTRIPAPPTPATKPLASPL